LGLQHIHWVRICYAGRWPHKHLQSLKSAYGHAAYLGDHLVFLEEVFSRPWEKLVDLNLAIMRHLMGSLQMETKLVLLSDMGIKARGTQLLTEVCRALGASTFLAQTQAPKYLDAKLSQKGEIEFRLVKYATPIYPQLWGDFLPNLSTFDLVFNCEPKARDILLRSPPTISGF